MKIKGLMSHFSILSLKDKELEIVGDGNNTLAHGLLKNRNSYKKLVEKNYTVSDWLVTSEGLMIFVKDD